MSDFLKQVKDFQKDLLEKQEKLASMRFEASSGGGMVTVTANGRGELIKVAIDPEIVNRDDVRLLQDLILSAVNEAMKKSQESQKDEIAGMMGNIGLKIPGLS